MKKNNLLLGLTILLSIVGFSQNVGINSTGADPDASAMLDIVSSDKGVLIPRVSLSSSTDVITIAAPLESLLVYNTVTIADVTPGFYYWNGGAWVRLVSGSIGDSDWNINANGAGLEASAAGDNVATGVNAVASGQTNIASGKNSVVGGKLNTASGYFSVVTGGYNNRATAFYSTISGGFNNRATAIYSTVLGGSSNEALGSYSIVAGGLDSRASGSRSSVLGGENGLASGHYSTSIGGFNNKATGDYSSASGYASTAQSYGEWVGGVWATIGFGNPTTYVLGDRLFVLGNGTGSGSRSNAFYVLKNGNCYTNGTTFITSDKRLKKNIKILDGSLANVLKLNGYSYFWKDNGIRSKDKQIGLLSQEVELLYPELIMDVEGVKALNYQGLIPVIIEATKEQQVVIRRVKSEIELSNVSEEKSLELLRQQLEQQQKQIEELKKIIINK